MSHHRQIIRDAVAAVLIGRTGAGGNVFTSRSRPIFEIAQKRELVLSVYTSDESCQLSGDGITQVRGLTVSIEGAAGGGDDLDDVLDDLAGQVEALIEADPSIGGLLSEELVLTNTIIEMGSKGSQILGVFRMDYDCVYLTQRKAESYIPGDQPGEEIIVPPVPVQVNISSAPTPIGYVAPINDGTPLPADVAALLSDDIAASPSQPAAPTESVCDPERGCDLPAWSGDQ